MFGFCCLLIVAHYVSPIFICYVIVMSTLLYPCALYHDILQRFHEWLEPVVTKWENSMNIRPKSHEARRELLDQGRRHHCHGKQTKKMRVTVMLT
ncbi:hypothetical protein LSAT2_004606 [Lamellibrachia satsuma]|nr:hypothetical protein LSAT2_004606 [Lamellibrachia satsuma]